MTSHAACRDAASAAWFDGLASGQLLIKQCRLCGHRGRPDTVACSECRSEDLEWARAAGAGTIVCVIIDHGTGEPAVLGLVELDEGPWLSARLSGVSRPAAGTRVSLSVHHAEDSEPIPVFTTDF